MVGIQKLLSSCKRRNASPVQGVAGWPSSTRTHTHTHTRLDFPSLSLSILGYPIPGDYPRQGRYRPHEVSTSFFSISLSSPFFPFLPSSIKLPLSFLIPCFSITFNHIFSRISLFFRPDPPSLLSPPFFRGYPNSGRCVQRRIGHDLAVKRESSRDPWQEVPKQLDESEHELLRTRRSY